MNCAATQMRGYGNEAAGDKWPPAQLHTHKKKWQGNSSRMQKKQKNKKNFAATLASDGCDQPFLILGDLQREGMGTHNTCMHTMRRRRLIDSPAALCVNSCLLFWKTIGDKGKALALSLLLLPGAPLFLPPVCACC